MRSTVRLNKLLRIILTGVTIGGGWAFNRAILLMVNDRAQTLKGILGVVQAPRRSQSNLAK